MMFSASILGRLSFPQLNKDSGTHFYSWATSFAMETSFEIDEKLGTQVDTRYHETFILFQTLYISQYKYVIHRKHN